jgi:hypothetical protein
MSQQATEGSNRTYLTSLRFFGHRSSNAVIPFHSLVLALFVCRLRSFPTLDAGSSHDIRSHPIAIGFTSILDGIGKATGLLIFGG